MQPLYPLTVLPQSKLLTSILFCYVANTVLFTVMPASIVYLAVQPRVHSLAMFLIVKILPNVLSSIRVALSPIAMHSIVHPLTIIWVSISLMKLALSVHHIIAPVSFVFRTIGLDIHAFSLPFVVNKASSIHSFILVCKLTLSKELSFNPGGFIDWAVEHCHSSFTVWNPILHFTRVNRAILKFYLSELSLLRYHNFYLNFLNFYWFVYFNQFTIDFCLWFMVFPFEIFFM